MERIRKTKRQKLRRHIHSLEALIKSLTDIANMAINYPNILGIENINGLFLLIKDLKDNKSFLEQILESSKRLSRRKYPKMAIIKIE